MTYIAGIRNLANYDDASIMSSPRIPYLHAELQALTRTLAHQRASTGSACAQVEAQVESLMRELSQLEGHACLDTSTLLKDIEETHRITVSCGPRINGDSVITLDPEGRAIDLKLSCLQAWWHDGTLHARLPDMLEHSVDPHLLDCVRVLVEAHRQGISRAPCMDEAMRAGFLDETWIDNTHVLLDPEDD